MQGTLQLREQVTSKAAGSCSWSLLQLEGVSFYSRKTQISFAGLKTKRNIEFFSLFSPNFDIKWKSKHLFFVCFQQRLLKLKYSVELKKSKILSTLIFHIASFWKEKNNACRRESCFFYKNHLLEPKSAFLRSRNMIFFRRGSWNCSLT